MRKTNHKKPLQLSTQTVKALDHDALARAGGALSYNGSENVACYLSAASICALCYK